jgi:acyl carrier protein
MEDRVRRIMGQVLQVDMSAIPSDASRDGVEAWDSLGHMRLCLALEEEFSIRFNDRQVVAMVDVAAVVATVEGLATS